MLARLTSVGPAVRLLLLVVTVAVAAALWVLVAYRTEPYIALALSAAVGAVLLAVWKPMLALYVAVALLPLQMVSVSLGDAGVTPPDAMFALVGAAWGARRLAQGEAPFTPSPLGKPLFLLLLAIVPGIAIASDAFSVIKTLIMWTAFVLVYQMIVDLARPEDIKRVLGVLVISGGIVGLISLGSAGEQELIGAGDLAEGRAVGSFDHPNTLAAFLGLTLPAALAFGLRGHPSVRPIGLVAFALAIGGLALSLSRGGLFAVVGALVVMLIWAPVRRAALVAATVVLILALTTADPLGDVQQVDTVEQRVASVSYAAEGTDPRFPLWQRLPEIVADHPLFGVGANEFSTVAPRYGLAGLDGLSSTYEHAHNIALTFLAELGVIGLAALVWLSLALARTLVRAYRRTSGLERGLSCAVAAALFAVALQGMVDYALRSNVIVALILTLAGCAVVLARENQRAQEQSELSAKAPA